MLTRGLGLHPGLEARLEDAARGADIPWQLEAMHVTGSTYTDVDGALDALAGTAAALVSIPSGTCTRRRRSARSTISTMRPS